jgi:hypothetical protein
MATGENQAWNRSEPGTGPDPVYYDPGIDRAIKNGWRRDTPPIVESPTETYEEVIDKQWDGTY